MLKLVGRSVLFAALAVPIAMLAGPLTASAEGPDDTANVVVNPRGGDHGVDVTAVNFSEVMAFAGAEGAFIDSVESSALELGRNGDGGHGDVTAVAFEQTQAFAGSIGAYIDDVESSAVEVG